MAGNKQRPGISAHGLPHRSRPSGASQSMGHLPVRPHPTGRDVLHEPVDPLEKRGRSTNQRDFRGLSSPETLPSLTESFWEIFQIPDIVLGLPKWCQCAKPRDLPLQPPPSHGSRKNRRSCFPHHGFHHQIRDTSTPVPAKVTHSEWRSLRHSTEASKDPHHPCGGIFQGISAGVLAQ